MISVAQARARMLEHIAPLPSDAVALSEAFGRVLAEQVVAPRAQPPFTASAMDGYAVRSADTPGRLRVVGASEAGRAFAGALGAGEAVRIFTGAPLPSGADAVVIQEEAPRSGEHIEAPRIEPGRHVRAAGIDFKAGAPLLEPGRTLDGPALALAAACGRDRVRVAKRPRIAILSGGDEIVAPGAAPEPAQIFDSASYGLAGLAAAWGALPTTHAPLADDPNILAAAVETALAQSELVIVIGGASVGDHDHARAAVEAIGADIVFDKVSVRPGKPTWFAQRGGRPILGLPGNPASALVCACLFLRPFIETLLGREGAAATRAARTRTPLDANGPRESYLRAACETDGAGQLWVKSFADQDSSLLSVFAASGALVMREAHAGAVESGEVVPIVLL